MKNYTQFVQELNEMFPGSKEYIAKFGKSQIKWSDDKEEKKPEADGEEAPKRGRGRPKGSYGSYKSHPENKGKYKGVHAARKAKVQEALEYMATLDESEYDAFLQSLDEELFSDLVEALDEEGLLSLEEQDIEEAKRTEVRDPKTGKVVKWKEEGDWHKSTGDVVDKSGAKHGAYSKVRDLARKGIKKVTQEDLDAMSDDELKVVKPVGDDKYLVKEEDLDEANLPKWEVSYDYGPHMSTSAEVSAKTKEDAAKKVIAAAKKKGLHPMLNYVRSVGVKEEVEIGVAESSQLEDFEQLDELSKKTLASYINKATKDVAAKYAKQGEHTGKVGVSRWDPYALTHKDAGNKRKVNVYRAIDKIGGKNNKTGSEVKGSVLSAATSAQNAAFSKAAGNKLNSKNLSNISKEHMDNVAKGVKKLTKEELETPVDVYTNFITEHKGA